MNVEFYHKNIDHLTADSQDAIAEKFSAFGEMMTEPRLRLELDKEKDGSFHMRGYLTAGDERYQADATDTAPLSCAEVIRDELKVQVTHARKKKQDLNRRQARSLKKKLTIDDKARLR